MGLSGLEPSNTNIWCERGDSNPHGFTRQILSLVRLPIPPLSHAAAETRLATIYILSDGIGSALRLCCRSMRPWVPVDSAL